MPNALLDYIETHKQDAVIFKATHLAKAAGDDLHARDQAFEDIANMLACLKTEMLVESYSKLIATDLKVKSATLIKKVKTDKDEQNKKEQVQHLGEGQKALPKWINKDRYYSIGFDWRLDTDNASNTGIYFPTSGGALQQLTNFVMTPLFHVYSKDDSNRRFTEINNGITKTVLELPSQIYTSADKFENELMNEGIYFCMDGFGKPQLNKLKVNFLPMYPKCYELKTLGWQPEGFFAFSNLVFKDSVLHFNDYGLVEVDEVKYLSMGASNALKDVRAEDDQYINDKYLSFVHTDINFSQWTQYMLAVYKDNGMMGVAWVLLAAYKDVVFKRNNNCPIPYGYGAVQSGKSAFAASVSNVFTHQMPAFNLNQGTEYAFRVRMERFRNVPAIFNEFDEQTIDETRFRAFKGAYDGEGREKGTGKGNKSKTQDVNCLPVLIGQFLSTRDDGSVVMRSIPIKFIEDNKRTPEQIEAYTKLKDHEKKGLSGILCEIFMLRSQVAATYNETYDIVAEQIRADFMQKNVAVKNRIVENFGAVLTLVKIIGQKIPFAFTYERFYEFCKTQVAMLNNVISESNSMAEFWKMMDFLVDQGLLEQGWDFKIEVHTEVTLARDRDSNFVKTFDKPTKLMFLRFNTVHALYSKEKRTQTGKPGLNEQTIITYMRDQDYYLGNNPGGNFRSRAMKKNMNTSSYVLLYDQLGVNLERMDDQDDARIETTLQGLLPENAKVVDIIGTVKVQFRLFQSEDYVREGGLKVEKKVYTSCFWNKIDQARYLLLGAEVRIRGKLSITQKGNFEYRNMEVTELEMIKAVMAPEEREDRFF